MNWTPPSQRSSLESGLFYWAEESPAGIPQPSLRKTHLKLRGFKAPVWYLVPFGVILW